MYWMGEVAATDLKCAWKAGTRRPLVGAFSGPWDDSHRALSETGECVLAVPTVDLAETVVDIGNCSGDALDKFDHFGLTPTPARTVDAPLVRECWVNLECRVVDDGWARRYNLWVLEVQRIWIDTTREEMRLIHHQGDGRFSVDAKTLDLGEHMTKWRGLDALTVAGNTLALRKSTSARTFGEGCLLAGQST